MVSIRRGRARSRGEKVREKKVEKVDQKGKKK
jgi:hypothetical protein